VVRPQPAQRPGEHQSRDDREGGERDQADKRLDRWPRRGAVDREENDREGDAGDVLEDAPAEECLFRLGRRRPPPAAGDVDDDDARRHRDAQTHRARPERRQARGQRRGRRDRGGDDGLQRRRPQELAVLPAQAGDVDLDAHLEQEQHDADVGEELELLVVGHVARRERRDQHADREVADDRRQPQSPGYPARERGEEQEQAQLEDRQGRRFHLRILRGRTAPTP
jgi:hypothetical protein